MRTAAANGASAAGCRLGFEQNRVEVRKVFELQGGIFRPMKRSIACSAATSSPFMSVNASPTFGRGQSDRSDARNLRRARVHRN